VFSNCKLGLRPPDPVRLSKCVGLSSGLTPELDALFSDIPCDWAKGRDWDGDQLDNDVWGDCGPASLCNWLKFMAAELGIPLQIDANTALGLYRALGWDGTFQNDNGVVMLDMLNYCMMQPTAGVQLDGFVSVPCSNHTDVCTAVSVYGPLLVGLSLTKACQKTDLWDIDAANDKETWGNHAVVLFSTSPGLYRAKSWGRPVDVTPEFLAARGNEAYLPLAKQFHSHLGISWDRLTKICKEI